MKKTLYIMSLAVFVAASCQKDALQDDKLRESTDNYKTLTVGTADIPQTRVGFDENYTFYWDKGDSIGVFTTAGIKKMTLYEQYDKEQIGVFYGDFQEEIGEYVVYPYGNHSIAEGQLTYALPSSYSYTTIAAGSNSFNPPMSGKINEGVSELKHLASFIRISVTNIPAGGNDMQFVLTADKRITGDFIADLSADVPVIVTDDSDGNSVTIAFSNETAGATGTFYVPVPLGTYDSITVQIMDGETLLATNTWSDVTVERMSPKSGTLNVNFIAKINDTLYGSLQDAIDDAVNHTIILGQDFVLDTPLQIAQGKNVVLELNGNTVYQTATSASESHLMAVKSGGSLTIKNGTLSFAATTPDTQWGGEGQPPYPGYANNTITNQGQAKAERRM